MAYVERDRQGQIINVYDTPQKNAQESVEITSEELLDFLNKSQNTDDAKTVLSASDLDLIRVIEDLIYTLVDKDVILFTDLPLAAREKLANRSKIRGQLNELDNLIDDSDTGIL